MAQRSERLPDGFVYALIERAAGSRSQLVAISPRVSRPHVGLARLPALPGLDDREMIPAHCMLQNVEPAIPFVQTALLGRSPQQALRRNR